MKRIFDILFSATALLITFPLILICIVIIKLEDPSSPVFYKQKRGGKNKQFFNIYKFRTMSTNAEISGSLTIGNDLRITKSGKWLRKFKIDELPQFFNVLIGDMSIVGPRPHMVEHDIHYSNLFFNFLKRHKCNPGLTGWAQVNGLRGATPNPEIMKRRMEFDLWYLNNWTIWLDLYIIFKTFYALIKYKGD